VGVHLYFDIRHNFDGRVVSGTCVTHFTPMEIRWEFHPLLQCYLSQRHSVLNWTTHTLLQTLHDCIDTIGMNKSK